MSKEGRRQRSNSYRKSTKAEFNPLRRRIILGGAAAASLVIFGGAEYVHHNKEKALSDEEIILNEAKRLGVEESESEKKLWADSYKNTQEVLPVDDANSDEFSRRIFSTLENMINSENPHFKDASEYLLSLYKNNNLSLKTFVSGDRSEGSAVSSYGKNDKGELSYEVRVSSQFVLNESSALTLAGVFNHESQHVKRFDEYRSQLLNLSPNDQLLEMDNHFRNQPQLIIEEAFAYGHEAEGYVYEAGLLGSLYDVAESGQEDRAAKFVSLGSDAGSSAWKQYITEMGGVS